MSGFSAVGRRKMRDLRDGDSQNDSQPSLTTEQRTELDHRLATLDRDRRAGITWAALKAELEQRCL